MLPNHEQPRKQSSEKRSQLPMNCNKLHPLTPLSIMSALCPGGPSVVLFNGTLTSGAPAEGGAAGTATAGAPGGAAIGAHAPPGLFAPNTLCFDPACQRELLSAKEVQALVHMLEDGGQLQCEVARCDSFLCLDWNRWSFLCAKHIVMSVYHVNKQSCCHDALFTFLLKYIAVTFTIADRVSVRSARLQVPDIRQPC